MAERKKVFLCDYPNFRTTRHWRDYLVANHDLVTDMYFNPVYAEWADVIWMEWCEYAAIEAARGEGDFKDVYDHAGIRGAKNAQHGGHFNWKGKKMIIRPIDIDIHVGHFRSVEWKNVDSLCYIAPHFGRMLRNGFAYPPELKIHETRLSVKLDEWRFKERTPGANIAWINHNWSGKNLPGAIYALKKLNELSSAKYTLHVVENKRSNENWLFSHVKHIIKIFGLEEYVRFYQTVPSIDEFLEDKNYLWQTSMKEGFSLIMGEALAKGIKALTLNWESSDEIWPKELVADTPEELALKTIEGEYNSNKFREIASRYSHDKEIAQLREITGL